MKVVPYDEDAYSLDHPMGTVSFNYMAVHDSSETLDGFRLILGRQEADFHMPRHRHPCEQIRLPLVGDMNLGEQGILHQGEIGYFPEGVAYGPQDDLLEDPKQVSLLLQFGGASGLGMGMNTGSRPDGRGPITEHRMSRARFGDVIKFNPARFNYLPVKGAPGVERKFFGSFTERAFWIERIKIAAGSQWVSTEDARRFAVVLAGAGEVAGVNVGYLAAIQAEVGETLTVTATAELELHVIGVPPVVLPEVPEEYDTIMSRGAIEYEKPTEGLKLEDAAAGTVRW